MNDSEEDNHDKAEKGQVATSDVSSNGKNEDQSGSSRLPADERKRGFLRLDSKAGLYFWTAGSEPML